ncbi:hypothetical protein LSH36_1640g00021, partial [Paralvinella palmiformis]
MDSPIAIWEENEGLTPDNDVSLCNRTETATLVTLSSEMYPVIFCLLVIIPVSASESPFACESTTVRAGNGQPYYQRINAEKTYDEAEDECRMKGAELYTTRNDAVKTETSDNASTLRTWISAKRRYWIHDSLHLGLSYESWARGHPISVENNCVYAMNKNTSMALYSGPCSMENNVICMDQELEEGNFPKTFTESLRICERHNGHLVAIFDKKQMKWISNTFTSSFWTGYKYNDNNTSLFWYDGHRVMNTNWKEGQPASGDCVVIDAEGKWQTEDCLNRHTFICILEVPYASKTTTCKRYDDECVCYWTEDKYVSFTEAMESCMSDGGTLGYPNSEEKLSFLSNLVHNENFWVGISDNHTKGVYRGSDASAITWIKWYHSYGPRVVTYNIQSKECSMSSEISDTWRNDPEMISRKRTKRVLDAASYCLDDLPIRVPLDEAIERCTNYKTDDICQKSPNITNGIKTVNMSSKDILYTCEDGYFMPTLNVSTVKIKCDCPGSEILLSIENCTVMKCNDSPNVNNANFSTDNNIFGSIMEIICIDWYWIPELASNTVNTTCVMDQSGLFATWCWTPPCQEIICPEPPTIPMGTYVIQENKAIYMCETNYKIKGKSSNTTEISCIYDENFRASWLAAPICQAISCPGVTDVQGANVLSKAENNYTGAVIQYRCHDGLVVYEDGLQINYTNQFNKTCIPDSSAFTGRWIGNYSCDSVTCSEPPLVLNSQVTARGYNIGDTALYTCDSQYTVISDSDLSNVNETWESTCVLDDNDKTKAVWNPILECIDLKPTTTSEMPDLIDDVPLIRQCPPINIGTKSLTHSGDLFINSPVSYVASVGYVFDNGGKTRSSLCLSGGHWSAAVPHLRRNRCPLLPPILEATKSTHENYVGIKVTIRCNDVKAKLENGLSEVTIKCINNEQWTFIPRSCETQRCAPFEYVEHSHLKSFNNTIGGLAILECNLSYRFADGTKTKTFRCLSNLSWESSERCYFYCFITEVDVCPPLRTPINGEMSTDIALEGTIVEDYVIPLLTKIGHENKDRESRGCMDDIRCPDLPELTNGNRSSSETLYNSNITYWCDGKNRLQYGYRRMTIRCEENGEWTHSNLSCDSDRCPPIPRVVNAIPSTSLAVN